MLSPRLSCVRSLRRSRPVLAPPEPLRRSGPLLRISTFACLRIAPGFVEPLISQKLPLTTPCRKLHLGAEFVAMAEQLARCSPIRRRRRDELRSEVELQRHAIDLADEAGRRSHRPSSNTKVEMRQKSDPNARRAAREASTGRRSCLEPSGRRRGAGSASSHAGSGSGQPAWRSAIGRCGDHRPPPLIARPRGRRPPLSEHVGRVVERQTPNCRLACGPSMRSARQLCGCTSWWSNYVSHRRRRGKPLRMLRRMDQVFGLYCSCR